MTGTASHSNGISLEEPLAISAPLAKRMAPVLCRKDSASEEDCSWYHGVWQYLRLLAIVRSPQHHSDFFCEALRSLVRRGGCRRVLISGSADYSMLALVLWAFRNENVVPEVHVIDACETPLFLNRWYAERARVKVETEASDILQWEAAEPFDIICTHSFLGRFNASARERLIAKWRQLLRPGGWVLTVNRVRPMARADKERFTPEQARAFQEAAVREAEKRRDVLGVEPEEAAKWAEVYVARQWTYPVKSSKEVMELFTAGGFVIDRLDLRSSGGGVGAAPSGPAAHGNAEYVHVVAWRGE